MSKGKAATPPETGSTLALTTPPDGDFERQVAETMLRPSVQGAATIRLWKPLASDVELNKLIVALQEQAKLASSGKLARSEAMLIIQAHTLDAVFNNLLRRASGADYLSKFEAYLRLGLKAQSQCRATLETLAAIKNPPPLAFVRQANIAHGPQQVNNGPQPAADTVSRARESENRPNKLLEQQRNEWLDPGTARAPASSNPSVETLGAIHRTKDARG
jgi:hypothetical protein